MPTLIYNKVTVSDPSCSDDVFRLTHMLKYCERGIFTALVRPEAQTDDARIEAWGTPTEIYPAGCGDENCVTIHDTPDSTLVFSFVTDGSPPRKVLEQLVQMGFTVECHYQSLRFCNGTWEQGHDQYSFQSLIYPQRTGRQQAALQITDGEF